MVGPGLLLETKGYQTQRTDRVMLIPSDEVRLTEWMHHHLQLNWITETSRDTTDRRLAAATQHPRRRTRTRSRHHQ